MKRIVYILILAITVIATLSPSAAAAEQAPLTQGLAISPPTFELSANPGDTVKNSIRVDNLTAQNLKVSVERKNFAALGEEGQVGLTDEENTFSLASWIKVDPEQTDISARSSKVFNFTIQVPANAEPGGRFGSIVFKTAAGQITGGGLAVGQELGSLLLLRIAGDVTEKSQIEQFKSLKSFMEYGPVAFDTRVKNIGNVHVKPTGTITVTDFFGRKVATLPVDSRNVLPGAIRKTETAWDKKHLFGKYTATLSLQYGSNRQIMTASTTFVVIPWRMVSVILAIVIVLGILAFLGRRRILRAARILFGKE